MLSQLSAHLSSTQKFSSISTMTIMVAALLSQALGMSD